MRPTRLLRTVTALSALVLLASACGGSDEAATSTTAPPTTAAPTTEAPTTTAEAAVETGSDEVPADFDAGDGSCLVGDWYIEAAELADYFDLLAAAATEGGEGPELSFEVMGGTGLAFRDDGTYEYTPELTLALELGGIEGLGEATGSLGGDYTVEDGRIITVPTDDQLEIGVTIGDATLDGAQLGFGIDRLTPINAAPLDCSTGAPIILFSAGPGQPTVQVELSPS